MSSLSITLTRCVSAVFAATPWIIAISFAFGDQLQDLSLTIGERIEWRVAPGEVSLNDSARNAGAQVHAGTDFADGNNQMLDRLGLCHTALHSRAQRLQNSVLVGVNGEHYDLRTRGDRIWPMAVMPSMIGMADRR